MLFAQQRCRARQAPVLCLPAGAIPLLVALPGGKACSRKGNAELCRTLSCISHLCPRPMAHALSGLPVRVFSALLGELGWRWGSSWHGAAIGGGGLQARWVRDGAYVALRCRNLCLSGTEGRRKR